MRAALSFAIICAVAGASIAQPGQTPLPPPPPLTPAEAALLSDGEISDGQHIGGGLLAIFPGFGLGQAVQGRWLEKGWMFTLGETVFGVAFTIGLTNVIVGCTFHRDECDEAPTLMTVGLIGVAAFRVWGAIDAFTAPPEHNRRVRALKARLGMPVYVGPYVAPPAHGDGAVGGVMIRF